MSVAEPKRNQVKQKQKDPKPQVAPHGTERLKTVVRRLPPNLPEEIFWQSVQAWVTDDSVTWKVYYAGKLRKRCNQENVPSRAYIAFKNEEVLATFSREYDGHLFRDKAGFMITPLQLSMISAAGNESQAVVEFAPFQKIPSEKRKPDARNATIDKDEDYISFLETLKNTEKSEHVSLESLIAASQPPAAPTTTPLLEALKAEKSAQKDKEAILRNHAHYKDPTIANTFRKEEVKKKVTAPTVASQKQPEAGPAPLSRKAKKAAAAAAQKVASPAQTTQGNPAAKGVSTETANLPAKPTPHAPTARTTPRSPRTARQQAPKIPAATSLPPKPVAQPAPSVSTDPAPPASNRRGRPVVGLGRQFEAALNGAVGPSGGKKREKEAQPGPASEAVKKDVPGKLKDASSPSPGVPNILQRGDGHAPVSPMIIQRPQPMRVAEGPAVVDPPLGRGGPPRRGRGRGRGVPPRGG
ncbi:hypothetical protein K503DRAFT_746484 [Rhizopogon vinicolor AM-OR11-026]|uniref:UPF3 domain-containing protein n=1 Tax=Rhizopogon vinicolor AM-OR11-026 TaxID=1314800 RepID=A0A1B7MR22_9AGAM|nr:hypothetical protein K503DRAFT_746484 [Rhizopogon vinicolor AM-OR11-026]